MAKPAYRANADDLATASRSAARLAAEAAFTEPQVQKLLLQPTQVIVRRSRSASPGIKSIPGDTVAGDIEPAVKSARVFRVASSPLSQISEAACADRASMLVGDAPVQAHGSPRSRRRADDRRPGPVLHVVHALPGRPAAEPAGPRLDYLIEELAKVGPILESIQYAQAFEIRDIGSAAAWEQMSKTAERLRADLLALLNASAIPSLFRSA
jgi:hypothetical protein